MELRPERVATDQLLIDPNNPRYFDLRTHDLVSEGRYAEDQIQADAAKKLIDSWDIRDLRRSILTNGFINFEHIVVKEYPHVEDRYVVIEGNRRLAAINLIRGDYRRGTLPNDEEYHQHQVAGSLDNITVLIFTGTEAEEKILQGIRHVSGPKEWKPYQQSVLVRELHEQREMSFRKIQDALGLGPTVVRRAYNTLKAFEQMRNDEEYGSLADRNLFSLFLEMLRAPMIRSWLEWSDQELQFCKNSNRKHIYRMIVGESEEGEEGSPVIRNPPDMRTFSRILGHEHRDRVLDRLLNGDVSIEQGWAILEPGIPPWEEMVATVIDALEKLPADALQALTSDKEQQLQQLVEVASRKLAQAQKLRN